MATTYALEVSPQYATPPGKSPGTVQGGRMRRWRATIALAAQPSADVVVLANVPAGHTFAYGILTGSVSLGTSTAAIGVAGTPAKYRAAAVNTAVDTPLVFGPAAAIAMDPLGTTGEQVILTIGAAALPGAGTLVVDLYYSAP